MLFLIIFLPVITHGKNPRSVKKTFNIIPKRAWLFSLWKVVLLGYEAYSLSRSSTTLQSKYLQQKEIGSDIGLSKIPNYDLQLHIKPHKGGSSSWSSFYLYGNCQSGFTSGSCSLLDDNQAHWHALHRITKETVLWQSYQMLGNNLLCPNWSWSWIWYPKSIDDCNLWPDYSRMDHQFSYFIFG